MTHVYHYARLPGVDSLGAITLYYCGTDLHTMIHTSAIQHNITANNFFQEIKPGVPCRGKNITLFIHVALVPFGYFSQIRIMFDYIWFNTSSSTNTTHSLHHSLAFVIIGVVVDVKL